jgi:hypothetical protein
MLQDIGIKSTLGGLVLAGVLFDPTDHRSAAGLTLPVLQSRLPSGYLT